MNEFLKSILDGLHTFIPSYGWCVVAFTIIIRLCLLPLDYKSRVGMRKMSQLAPKQAALQKKYEKDPEKYQRKVAELYKKERVTPMSGCWPMLISMPILLAMFTAMRMMANEQLAQQVFGILLNGEPQLEPFLWIRNLWMPDSPFNAAWPSADNLRLIEANQWMYAVKELNLTELVELSGILNANLGAVSLPDAASIQVLTEGMSMSGLIGLNSSELLALAEAAKIDVSALALTDGTAIAVTESSYNAMMTSIYHAFEALFSTAKENNTLSTTIQLIADSMKAMPAYIEHTAVNEGWTINLIITSMTVAKEWNGLFLLPLMSGGSQYLMTVLNPTTPNQTPATDKDGNPKPNTGAFMKWFFPLFSLCLCASYNAAFATYWVTSNLIAMAQTILINKYLDRKEANARENPDIV